MAENKFGRMAVSQIKNTAKSCFLLTRQKEKLEKEIAEKQAELETINTQWEEYQAPIRRMTGGYTTNDLLNRVVRDTGKTDKDGRPIKVTTYELKYPETVIPVAVEGDAEPVAPAEEAAPAEPEVQTEPVID